MLGRTNKEEFGRDLDNLSLVNTDEGALIYYKQKRQEFHTIETLKKDILILNEEIKGIKILLHEILEKDS